MASVDNWIDLLDPTPEELAEHLPGKVHEQAREQLLAPAQHDDEPRPKLESHGDYVFGVFLVAVAVREEDLVYYQEIDFVMTRECLVTIRKTPPNDHPPFDPVQARAACRNEESIGMIVYHFVDDIAQACAPAAAQRFVAATTLCHLNAAVLGTNTPPPSSTTSTLRQNLS